MRLVRHQDGRRVYYDKTTDTYIKHFPGEKKLSKLLKYFLGIRRYPGKNFEYVSKKLKQFGIETIKVIHAENFLVITKARHASTLSDYLAGEQVNDHPEIRDEFLNIMITLLNSGIQTTDFDTLNYLYDGEKIIVIDLDSYRNDPFLFRPREIILNAIEKYHGKEIRNDIDKKWTKRTWTQRIIDVIYYARNKSRRSYQLLFNKKLVTR